MGSAAYASAKHPHQFLREGAGPWITSRTETAWLGDAFVLDGGLNAWVKAGLPVVANAKAPLEIMRQVQIAAGSLVLIGVLLGLAVTPAWFGLSAFVGAGLTFAGVTGFCGMARLLMLAPWNRRAISA